MSCLTSLSTFAALLALASVAVAEPVPPPRPFPEPPRESAEPAPDFSFSAAPGKGVTVQYGESFSLNLRSRIQIRYQLELPPPDDTGDRDPQQLVNIGTARLAFSGFAFSPKLTYMIQLAVAERDYRDGTVSPLFDAYIDWKAHPELSLRAGQFFVPFDRLRTVREFALQMADRPIPILELTLDRDIGVVLYSERFLGTPLTWRAGVFGGGGINRNIGKQPGVLAMGRLELRPLGPIDDDSEGDLERRSTPGLALGAGVGHNWNTNRQRSTTGATFLGGTTDYLHLVGDVTFKWLGVATQFEYLFKHASKDQLLSDDGEGGTRTEWTRSAHGWVAQASYIFSLPFEVVARVTQLYPLEGTDPRLLDTTEYGAGLNYYLHGHQFKFQADWIAKVYGGDAFDDAAHVAHVQLDATF